MANHALTNPHDDQHKWRTVQLVNTYGGQSKHEKTGGLSIGELSCKEFLHNKIRELFKHIGE